MNLAPEGNQPQLETMISSPPNKKVTNQTVLLVTTLLFAGFVIAEIIGALAGNSLSLLGDGAAMSVDVLTYCTNMYAERMKSSGREIDEKTRMFMEVYIPSFSVLALLAVTGWITSDAITAIINKGHDSDEVDVYFLYGFASANFLVDILSSLMFYFRGSEAFRSLEAAGVMNPLLNDLERSTSAARERESVDGKLNVFLLDPAADAAPGRLNLNMCSALTHLGGDTMRTSSVFIAAVVATTTKVSGNLCDAWAAIIVTVTIVALVIPLIYQIYKAATYKGGMPTPVMV